LYFISGVDDYIGYEPDRYVKKGPNDVPEENYANYKEFKNDGDITNDEPSFLPYS